MAPSGDLWLRPKGWGVGEVTFSRVEVSTPKVRGAVRRALRRMNKSATRLAIVRSVQHITQTTIGSICNIHCLNVLYIKLK